MARKGFNWTFAIALILGLLVLSLTAITIRQNNRTRKAENGLVEGKKAYEQGRWEQAAHRFGQYLGMNPNDVEILQKYADAHLRIRPLKKGNIQQAIGAYRNILINELDNNEAAINLIQIYMQQRLTGESINIANDFLSRTGKPDPEIQTLLALCYFQEKKFKEAKEQLDMLVKNHSDHIPAYELYANCIRNKPDEFHLKPSDLFNLAVEKNPESPLARILRANYFLDMNEFRETAFSDIETAQELIDKEDTAAVIKLARLMIGAGMLEKAKHYLDDVENRDAGNSELWEVWAAWARQSDEPQQKIAIASRGLDSLKGDAWDFMLAHAVELYLQAGAKEMAVECLEKLEEIKIATGLLAFYRGIIAFEDSNPYEVITRMQKAIPSLGASSMYINKLLTARRMLAEAYMQIDDVRSAESQYKIMVDEFPYSFRANMEFARFLQQMSNFGEALAYVRQARQINPDDKDAAAMEAHLMLVTMYQGGQGDAEEIDALMTSLMDKGGDAIEINLLKIERLIYEDKLQQAQTLIDDLKTQYPSELKLDLAEVNLLRIANDTDRLETRLNTMREKHPDSLLPLIFLVNWNASQESYDECITLVEDALQRFEGIQQKRDLMFLLAEIYDRAGLTDKQLAQLEEIEAAYPRDIKVKTLMLNHESVQDDPERSQKIIAGIKDIEGDEGWQWRYEQARLWLREDMFSSNYPALVGLLKENLKRDPDDQVSRVYLAQAYERHGELQLAASMYQTAYSLSPDNVNLIVQLVSVLNQLGKSDEARQILNQAAYAKIEDPRFDRLKFESYIRQGEVGASIEVLEAIMAEQLETENADLYLDLARLKMNIGRYDEAQTILMEQIQQNPDDSDVIETFIQLRYLENKYDQALALCNKLIEVRHDAAALCTRAEIHAHFDRHDKAREDFTAALDKTKDDPLVWLRKCDYHRRHNEPEEALAALEEASRLDPENQDIILRQISLLQSSGTPANREKARQLIEQALNTTPDNYQLLLYKAENLLRDGTRPSTEDAVRILRNLTREYPERPVAWRMWGEIALAANKPHEAADIVMKAFAAIPNKNDRGLLLLKARAESQLSMSMALSVYEKLHELYPRDIEVIVELASAYVDTKEYDSAISLLKNNMSYIAPRFREAAGITLAMALYKKGDIAAAEEQFTQLKQNYTDSITPYLAHAGLLIDEKKWNAVKSLTTDLLDGDRGPALAINLSRQLFARSGNPPEARQLAEWMLLKAMQANKVNVPVRMTLAEYWATHKRGQDAIDLYKEILRINPDNLVALNNLSYLLVEHTTDYQEALKYARKGLELRPDYIDLIDTLGMIHFKMQNYQQAISHFDKSIHLYHDNDPALARSIGRRAEVWAAMNNRSRALEDINQALSLNNVYNALAPEQRKKLENLRESLSQNN